MRFALLAASPLAAVLLALALGDTVRLSIADDGTVRRYGRTLDEAALRSFFRQRRGKLERPVRVRIDGGSGFEHLARVLEIGAVEGLATRFAVRTEGLEEEILIPRRDQVVRGCCPEINDIRVSLCSRGDPPRHLHDWEKHVAGDSLQDKVVVSVERIEIGALPRSVLRNEGLFGGVEAKVGDLIAQRPPVPELVVHACPGTPVELVLRAYRATRYVNPHKNTIRLAGGISPEVRMEPPRNLVSPATSGRASW